MVQTIICWLKVNELLDFYVMNSLHLKSLLFGTSTSYLGHVLI
jgi:hypothetical protein